MRICAIHVPEARWIAWSMLSDTLKTLFDLEQVFDGGPDLLEQLNEREMGESRLFAENERPRRRSCSEESGSGGGDTIWRMAEVWESTSWLGF